LHFTFLCCPVNVESMTIIAFFLIFISLVNITLAGLVLFQRAKSEINRVFAVSSIAIAGWTLTNALFQVTTSTALAMLTANISYIFAIVTAASFLHFAWIYPRPQCNSLTSRKYALWTTAALCAVLPFVPNFVIQSVELKPSRRIFTGSGVYVIAAFVAFTILSALFTFYRNQRQWRGKEREQARYVLLGAGILTFFGLTFNLLLPLLGEYSYVWLGPTSSVIFVGFTVYSIVAHQLFDIRLIIQRAVVYTLLLGLLIAAFAIAVLLLTNVLQHAGSSLAFLSNPFVSSLIAALLIGFGVDPLRRWLVKATDGFLFQQERREQELLIGLSQRLSDMVLEEDVLNAVMKSIEQSFHPKATALYLFDHEDENEEPSITHTKKSGEKSLIRMTKDELVALIAELQQTQSGSKVLDGGARAFLWPHQSPKPAHNEYSKFMPQGLLLLGPKRSGSPYAPEDEALLDAICTQAVSALHKAKLYQRDRQKTEFVSIAAHELLTPIAAAEGYLSFILDEHMGQVDKQADGYLRKVYASTHRLHALVKDLLSVSRIEAGRTKFSPVEINIEQLITDAIDQLQLVAAEKGLALIFQKPAEPLPPAFADPDKVTEVLINLMGNAVKYTPKGQVRVSAAIFNDKGKPQILVSIADTGLGMPKKAQEHLFEKFYRVSSPETATIQGTGLGLYITKTIVEKMGGKIWVESAFGQGSTFFFTLPVSPSSAPRNVTAGPPASTVESS
jgi:signal transduction histidine kinase